MFVQFKYRLQHTSEKTDSQITDESGNSILEQLDALILTLNYILNVGNFISTEGQKQNCSVL